MKKTINNNVYDNKEEINHFTQMASSLDKMIFTTSTGTIVISVNFISSVIKNPSIHTIHLITYSWGILILSIISIIGSYFWSIYITSQRIKLEECNEESMFKYLTRISALLMIIGIILLGLAVINNFNQNLLNDCERSDKYSYSVLESTEKIELYELPDKSSNVLYTYDEGTVVKSIYQSKEWILIKVGNEVGWSKKSNLKARYKYIEQ
ncbi:MAG: hypothetical protein N4A76_15165 [Firmicutes bacterium]|jgi:hypothetical protein|nr:hypothetical protein [Bacillota bacterium]